MRYGVRIFVKQLSRAANIPLNTMKDKGLVNLRKQCGRRQRPFR